MANFEKRLVKLEQTTNGYLPIPVHLDVLEGETEDQAKVRISKNYANSQVIIWLSRDDVDL